MPGANYIGYFPHPYAGVESLMAHRKMVLGQQGDIEQQKTSQFGAETSRLGEIRQVFDRLSQIPYQVPGGMGSR